MSEDHEPSRVRRTRKPSSEVVGVLISEELYGLFEEATARLFPAEDTVDIEFAQEGESATDLVPDELFSTAEIEGADFGLDPDAIKAPPQDATFWETAGTVGVPEKTYRLMEASVAIGDVERAFGPLHSEALLRKLWEIDAQRASCGLTIRSVLGAVSLVLDNGSIVALDVYIASRTTEPAAIGTAAWKRQQQRFAGELLLEHDVVLDQIPQPTVSEIHSHGTLGAWMTERLRSRVTRLSARSYLDPHGLLTAMPPLQEFLARASVEPQTRAWLRGSEGRVLVDVVQGVPEEAGVWGLLVAASTAGAIIVDPVQDTTEFVEVAESARFLLDELYAKIGRSSDAWFGVGEGATLRELRRAFDEERVRLAAIQLPDDERVLVVRRQHIQRAMETAYDQLRRQIIASQT